MKKTIKIQSPGRICVIGEHVDYIYGYSIAAAINLYLNIEINLLKEQQSKKRYVIVSDNFSQTCIIEKHRDSDFKIKSLNCINNWIKYPLAALKVLYEKNFNIPS